MEFKKSEVIAACITRGEIRQDLEDSNLVTYTIAYDEYHEDLVKKGQIGYLSSKTVLTTPAT
ncbi:hypothetical protein T265_12324 [Opisthorchis viverrini]|uniref:Uncharacterized protein n=1 Tax=Opisthorchis viverrini TaxID=6198 RepID=A0A074YYK5_OPIVI|nr:hypothetical protein T265_12324 [Opisthorchis viverrini]KER18272.1 hypothetical protein T265_12324 [Opisthorchis viverrini]